MSGKHEKVIIILVIKWILYVLDEDLKISDDINVNIEDNDLNISIEKNQ